MANDTTAINPQWWVFEGLTTLKKTTVLPMLVNRDYDAVFAKLGDVVNINRTGTFTAKRKIKGSPITIQDAVLYGDTVRLNQHLHVSYELEDRDLESTPADLKRRFVDPGFTAIADGIDLCLMGESYNFLGTIAGQCGVAIDTPAMRDLNEKFTRNLVPRNIRNLILGPASENDVLGIEEFTEMQTIGDGSPLKNGQIGRAMGFDIFVVNQASEVSAPGLATSAGAVNHSGGYPAATTTLVVDGISGKWKVGAFITIAGDVTPQLIVAQTDDATNTTGITIFPGLEHAVANDAVITYYTPGAINLSAGYDAQYAGELVVDGFSGDSAVKVGQGVYIAGSMYMVTGVTVSTNVVGITLNRPLDSAVSNDAVVGVTPPANYNFAMVRDAVTLVCRPMRPVDPGTGVNSAWAVYKGIPVRVTIGYNMTYMKYVVTIDTLFGVKTLNQDLGGVLLS